MFNAQDLGKDYVKLVQAHETDLAEDIVKYDGDGTYLLDCYVTDDLETTSTVEDLDVVDAENVDCVLVMGTSDGSVRCYTKSITVLVTAEDERYMDLAYYDLVFA